jgi:hypothetical protein
MVLDAKAMVGVKVAVVPEYETDPVIAVAPCFTVKVVELRDDGFIGTLKVAATVVFSATPIALFAGLIDITAGATSDPVVNVHT